MQGYFLESGSPLAISALKKVELPVNLAVKVEEICYAWQARDLRQEGNSNYGDDGITSSKVYEELDCDEFVFRDEEVVGYYADHFGEKWLTGFTGKEKLKLGDYDDSDYHSGSGRVKRGHVSIVPKPDLDTNPYHDEPRFHSQAEYDDYIKWMD